MNQTILFNLNADRGFEFSHCHNWDHICKYIIILNISTIFLFYDHLKGIKKKHILFFLPKFPNFIDSNLDKVMVNEKRTNWSCRISKRIRFFYSGFCEVRMVRILRKIQKNILKINRILFLFFPVWRNERFQRIEIFIWKITIWYSESPFLME